MNRFLTVIVLIISVLFLGACEDLKPQIEDLNSRLTALEGTKIPSIEQQIQAIQTSIGELKEMDKTLKGYIDVLNQKDLPELQDAIQHLQAKDEELEGKIVELQHFISNQIGSQSDWVTVTYCTLEQYQQLVDQLWKKSQQYMMWYCSLDGYRFDGSQRDCMIQLYHSKGGRFEQ